MNFDIIAYSRLLLSNDASDFSLVVRSSRITQIYNDKKEFDFKNMVALNIAEGICLRYWSNEQFKELIRKWLLGKHEMKFTKGTKNPNYILINNMHKLNSVIFSVELSPIISSILIGETLRAKMTGIIEKTIISQKGLLFVPNVNKYQNKERQARQLEKQENEWYEADAKRTEQIRIARQVDSDIKEIMSTTSEYNIQKVKYEQWN
jgi:hypothetical protein